MRAVRWAGAIALGFLFVLAWHFHLERTACFDSAFYSFLLIDTGEVVSFHHRIGSWLPQFLPLALIRGGASLDLVLLSYSLCLALVPVGVFALIGWPLRDTRGAMTLPLTLVAGMGITFYYGVSEVNQGIAFCVLLEVLFRRTVRTATRAWVWGAAALLTAVWASLYHQVLLIPIAFLIVYVGIDTRSWRNVRYLVLSALLVLLSAARLTLIQSTDYEQARMPTYHDVVVQLPALWELPSTLHLLDAFADFKAFLLLMALACAGLVWARRYWSLAWTLLFSSASLALILIADRAVGSAIMFENFYPVIAFCWCAAFTSAAHALYTRAPRWVLAAACSVMALGAWHVVRSHHLATDKVRYAERLTSALRDRGVRKAIGTSRVLPWGYVLSHWPVPMETALISALHGPDSTVTFFCDDAIAPYRAQAGGQGSFIGPSWDPEWFDGRYLNERYFALPHTGYELVTTSAHDALDPNSALTLEPLGGDLFFTPAQSTVVPIRITNHGATTFGCLAADQHPLRLRCTVHSAHRAIVLADPFPTAMEQDIAPHRSIVQGLTIPRPDAWGDYLVVVELLRNDSVTGVRTELWIRALPFGL